MLLKAQTQCNGLECRVIASWKETCTMKLKQLGLCGQEGGNMKKDPLGFYVFMALHLRGLNADSQP